MSYLRAFWIGTFLLVAVPSLIAHLLYMEFGLLTDDGRSMVWATGAYAFLAVMTFLMARRFLPRSHAVVIVAVTLAASALLIYAASYRNEYGHPGGFLAWAAFLLLSWKADSVRSTKADRP